ncbi:hypothetical protein BOC42_20450 [Burkholderia pseudomallei]|nr:hypothetical protein BOC60_10255 [Burkholderia pseudomallei]ARK65622.1 hypothetical protein BOC38_01855 [Burkholderia pseudomallei]ARK89449.1 hypothetical protein BOC42_20450 [Burkholderia pseudomallei]OMQ70081.1 hypothetical protein AQ713_12570 [Burkholderia pseudomallei]
MLYVIYDERRNAESGRFDESFAALVRLLIVSSLTPSLDCVVDAADREADTSGCEEPNAEGVAIAVI